MSMFGASEQSPRMFKSDFIDFFSRTHFSIVAILYVPASLALMAYSVIVKEVALLPTLGLAVAGVLAWTFTEYWLHRTFFHWEPNTSWGPKLHFLVHGVHHTWPRDKYRLVMPPAVSISLFVIFLVFWWAVLGSLGYAFHSGFVIGYIIYDLTHYYLHHAKPKSTYFKKLRRHHMSHHFNEKYAEARFGVSTRFWDRIFGTL